MAISSEDKAYNKLMEAPISQESPEAAQTAAYFDAEAAGWSARYAHSRHFRTRLQTVLGWLDKDASRNAGSLDLLDYGCGSGVLMGELLRRGHAATGVDVSARMLEEARHQLAPLGKPFRLRRVDAAGPDVVNSEAFTGEPPAFSDSEDWRAQAYDGIFCLGVLEYVDTPEGLLEILADLLKPGGFLIVSYPNAQSLLRRVERWIFEHPTCFAAMGMFPHLTGEDSYLHFQKQVFSQDDLEQLLASQGLTLCRARYHVAPVIFGNLQNSALIGMTAISEFRKSGNPKIE